MAQMYACGLFEAKFLDEREETAKRLWRETKTHFMQQFNKERRKMKYANAHKSYKSSTVFREAPNHHTLEPPKGGATVTTANDSFTVSIEYAAAL